MPDPADAAPSCIYYLHHRQVGRLEAFTAHLDRARALGFDTVLISPPFETDGSGDVFTPLTHDRAAASLGEDLTARAALSALAGLCRERGLRLFLDLCLSRFSAEHELVRGHPNAFSVRRAGGDGPIDPRHPTAELGEARTRFGDAETARLMLDWSEWRIASWTEAGVCGFRVLEAQSAPPSFWRALIESARSLGGPVVFIAEMQGLARDVALSLASTGFDAVTSSVSWWDGRAPWLVEEYEALRPYATLIGVVEAPFGPRVAARSGADPLAEVRRRLALAAAAGTGLLMPMGVEFAARERLDANSGDNAALVAAEAAPELTEAVRRATAQARAVSRYRGEMRLVSGQGAAVTVVARADAADFRSAERVLVTLINTHQTGESPAPDDLVPGAAYDFTQAGGEDPFGPLKPGEVRVLEGVRAQPIRIRSTPQSAKAAARAPRIVVEAIDPVVSGGAFAVKRIVGETVTVEADVFMDGHDLLAVELQWRPMGEDAWSGVRMLPLENNRWRGDFRLERLGRHEFRIEAWLDRFGGYRRDMQKKIDANVAADVDFQEGVRLVAKAAERSSSDTDTALRAFAAGLAAAGPAKRRKLLLAPETAALMQRADARAFSVKSAPQWIDAERLAARFSSWYELFPRSQSDSPSRHGTFDDVIARLPAIRVMGFDTLYFPPIHPIGKTNRKGRNNSLKAGPDDPGSPYAIGSEHGGHEAIHAELGSFEDFRRLIGAAAEHGLEIALDFAIQCSPDHPWLKQHPGWFDWRPDGSIKYAENPPKRYEDIVNVDFYAEDAIPGLWLALRDIVLLWVREGVKSFRVDNPHTKPLPFWEWMIGEVRGQHPEVIFLAEAFTHPKMMYRLAKVGFSQSYTYFTWRDRKDELAQYLTELTTTAPKEFFRPHFFVNTPDINPPFLQGAGRAGFLARAALAATLSGLWGVYSGFELLEAEAVPGKEEYKDSEKYEIKPRDWTAPGNIIAEIARLNRIRKSHPALQTHLGVEFYNAWNDHILYYGKLTEGGGDMILVAVNLDPNNAQSAEMEIPLWRFGLPDDGAFEVEDLLHGARFVWRGKRQSMWLSTDLPYAIWRVQPEGAR